MRIAIVTEQPAHGGSSFYRGAQHVSRMRARGVAVDLLSPQALERSRPGQIGRAGYFARHAAGYVRRWRTLARTLPLYDAVLVQRGLYPLGPASIVNALERVHGPVVFDLDDAVHVVSPQLATRSAAARWAYGSQQGRRLLERADAVVVSTPALADTLDRPVDAILPTVPDTTGYPSVEQLAHPPLRVGWVGSAGNLRYLDPLREVFARLRADRIAELTVVCSEPWDGPAAFVRWRRRDDPAMFGHFDIGIMPLPDIPYARTKAGFKLLQHMAAGSPVVASPVGVNTQLVRDSDAGVLATRPHEWDAAIRELAGDLATRCRMGAAGRAFTLSYADLDRQCDTLLGLLSSPAR
jgi:hypothetical protein